MKKNSFKIFLCGLILCFSVGCATVSGTYIGWVFNRQLIPDAYTGPRMELKLLKEGFTDDFYFIHWLAIIDLPLSLVADTALLPLNGLSWLFDKLGDTLVKD